MIVLCSNLTIPYCGRFFHCFYLEERKNCATALAGHRAAILFNCYLFREGRNHEIWLNPDTGKEFQIPRHYSKELPIGTANNILKAVGLLGR